MGIPDHLTCLLRNLYAGQEATVRTGHGTTDWFQRGKGVRQGYILSPCLFNLYAWYIMRNARLDEALREVEKVTLNSRKKYKISGVYRYKLSPKPAPAPGKAKRGHHSHCFSYS